MCTCSVCAFVTLRASTSSVIRSAGSKARSPLGARAGGHHRTGRPSHGRRDARVPRLPRGHLRAAPHGPHARASPRRPTARTARPGSSTPPNRAPPDRRRRASRRSPVSVATSMRLTSSNGAKALGPIAPPATHIRSFPSSENLAHVTLGLFPVEVDRAFHAADRDGVERAFVAPARRTAALRRRPWRRRRSSPARRTPPHLRRRAPHDAVALVRAQIPQPDRVVRRGAQELVVFADIDTDTTCFVSDGVTQVRVVVQRKWYRVA